MLKKYLDENSASGMYEPPKPYISWKHLLSRDPEELLDLV